MEPPFKETFGSNDIFATGNQCAMAQWWCVVVEELVIFANKSAQGKGRLGRRNHFQSSKKRWRATTASIRYCVPYGRNRCIAFSEKYLPEKYWIFKKLNEAFPPHDAKPKKSRKLDLNCDSIEKMSKLLYARF